MGPLIVTCIRILVPLSILRYPLLGGILSMIVDTFDVVMITLLGMGDFTSYHTTDKMLDMYYLGIEAGVSWRWRNSLARNTSIILFIYRLLGFILFEMTKMRFLLLLFPNLFENFYLFYLGYKKILKKDPITSKKSLFIVLLILLIPKMIQEYALHFLQLQPWNFIKEEFLGIPVKSG